MSSAGHEGNKTNQLFPAGDMKSPHYKTDLPSKLFDVSENKVLMNLYACMQIKASGLLYPVSRLSVSRSDAIILV